MAGDAEVDAGVDARVAVAEVPVAVEPERELVSGAAAEAQPCALPAALDVSPNIVGEQVMWWPSLLPSSLR